MAKNSVRGRLRLDCRPNPGAWNPLFYRACFSRLVLHCHKAQKPEIVPLRVCQCTNCGLEAAGASPSVRCSCRLQMRRPTDKPKLRRSDFLPLLAALQKHGVHATRLAV